MANTDKYRLVESTGKDKGHRIEAVHTYDDLEKHHPSSGRESGRNYQTINGKLEEIRTTADGRTLVKKDMIFQTAAGAKVDVPAPVAGYVRTSVAYGTVAIYDKPQGGKLLGQVLHLNPNFRVKNGDYVAYGQPIGIQGGTGKGGRLNAYGIHAHVELEESAFRQYISDIDSGVIKPGVWPEKNGPAKTEQSAPAQQQPQPQPKQPAQPEPKAEAQPKAETPAQPTMTGSATSRLIARETSGATGYDTVNFMRGSTDSANLTINEYLRRSQLPLTDADRLISVGRYQVTPGTMRDAMEKMQLSGDEKLTPELQEQMFAQYLIQERRPDLYGYLTGTQPDVNLAIKDAAIEWAAIANPETGLSNYPPKGKAAISVEEMTAALNEDRAQIQQLMQQGHSVDDAYRAVIGGQGAQNERQQEQPGPTTPGEQTQQQGQNGQSTPGEQAQTPEARIQQLEQQIALLEAELLRMKQELEQLRQTQSHAQTPNQPQTQAGIQVGVGLNGAAGVEVHIHQQAQAQQQTQGGPAGQQPGGKPQVEIGGGQPPKPQQTGSDPAAVPGQSSNKPPETQEERQRFAVDYFQKNGFSRAQAIGLVANLTRESSMKTGAVGDGGKAYGLAQWHPDRQANFQKEFGKDIRQASFEEQLKFVCHELLRGQEKRAGRELLSQHTAAGAAAAVSKFYERPANTEQEMQTRANIAQQLEQTLGQSHGQTQQVQQQQQRNPAMTH